jgi:hypothetical protein
MKLLDQIRALARVNHFSIRTERAYVHLPYAPTLIRDAPSGDGTGHPHGARAARP